MHIYIYIGIHTYIDTYVVVYCIIVYNVMSLVICGGVDAVGLTSSTGYAMVAYGTVWYSRVYCST